MDVTADFVTADIIEATVLEMNEISVTLGLKIWKAIVNSIAKCIRAGHPVRLERFCTFIFDGSESPTFIEHPDFTRSISANPTGQIHIQGSSNVAKLSLSCVASEVCITRETVQRFLQQVFCTVRNIVRESNNKTIRLGFLPLGDWVFQRNTSSFVFQPRSKSDKIEIKSNRAKTVAKSSSSTTASNVPKYFAPSKSCATSNASSHRQSKTPNDKAPSGRSQHSTSASQPTLTERTLKSFNRTSNISREKNHSNSSPSLSRAIASEQIRISEKSRKLSNNHKDVLDRVKQALLDRGGSHGIHGISRMMRIMDNSGDKRLNKDEFRYGLRDFGVDCNEVDLDCLMSAFDRDGDGFISFDEFLLALRGDINPARMAFIEMAFHKLDRTKDGAVTTDDLRNVYDASKHPDFIQGKKTEDQILAEFLSQWDTDNHDGIVTFDEFVNYYRNVSASIDDDNYFELMMRNSWHISGGKGQCANSSIKRVLVTHLDGHQTVEEVTEPPPKENLAETDPLAYCKKKLFTPPCSVDVLAQRLGANRVMGNGQERIHVKVFAKALCQLDKTLIPRQANLIAKSFYSTDSQLIDIPILHTMLSDRFGKVQRPTGTVLDRLKTKILARGGTSGLHGIQRMMKIWDDSGDGKLTKDELKKGLQDYGVEMNLQEIDHLMSLFDTDKSGTISFDELLIGLRGTMSEQRLALVHQAFRKLDATGDGQVTIDDLRLRYDVSRHPDVITGKISERQALVDFMAQWDTDVQDGIVSLQEFELYYKNVSASIDGDDYFECMIRNAWQLDPVKKLKAVLVKADDDCTTKSSAKSKPKRNDEPKFLQTRAEREKSLEILKSLREKAALVVQAKFRGHKGRMFVDCVKRKQAVEALKKQQVAEEAKNAKPKVCRPALRTYHGF
ncbi:Aste57867_3902 [Aphanomyces stellatus]|uniref:Aste57867_3902 protein n=1 Tax=Aphanomyces stellatus TaxID=120398 RepID=A0A485KCY4_9STRA|nr:hypothetical protein As57867_003891 [Aphanomyces stellatus]VFT81043.1 Aste57867_3902 [Aphanomyces stellatus]